MFALSLHSDDPATRYAELSDAADAITAGESDAIANMANVAALIWEALPDLNWAGFYRMSADRSELVLGPFQGKAACIRIALGKGVCGTAAASGEVQLVEDVNAFPGHIACDSASNSEIVIPIRANGQIVGVLDIDSPRFSRSRREVRSFLTCWTRGFFRDVIRSSITASAPFPERRYPPAPPGYPRTGWRSPPRGPHWSCCRSPRR